MSFHSIKIDTELYDISKKYATAENRTISGQITYWAKLGKLSLENPDLPIGMIQEILIAKHLKDEFTSFAFQE